MSLRFFATEIERQAINSSITFGGPCCATSTRWLVHRRRTFDFSDTVLPAIDHRSSFPFPAPEFQASESAALAHLVQYSGAWVATFL